MSDLLTLWIQDLFIFSLWPLQKECPFLFKNGTLKPGGEREPVPRPKKWPVANILAPGGQNIPEAFITGGAFEEEDGELNTPEVSVAELEKQIP